MKRWKIVLTDEIHTAATDLLSKFGEYTVAKDEVQLLELIREADALLVRRPLPKNICDDAGNLKIIVRHGVGVDYIPVDEATKKGVLVANVPAANTQSVVEHVIGVLLLLARNFDRLNIANYIHEWSIRNSISSIELMGKTIGVIGFGRIGRTVGNICRDAFGMKLKVYDPFYKGEDSQEILCDLEELFSSSDFISVHCPLTPETTGLINENLLSRMKSTAFLVNAARGALVVEDALVKILKEKKIAGAALDVYMDEPINPNSPLRDLDNVILTPHTAALTVDSIIRMGVQSVEEIQKVYNKELPKNLINPDALRMFKERFDGVS